ncbi:MAG: hypothetical protein ACREQO_22625, partial [Candidatus Binatia bacterium]
FIATMRAGRSLHTGVFKRLGRPGTGNPKYRRLRAGVVQLNPRLTSSMRDEQVAELFGPSVALVFSRRRVKDKIRSFVRERLTIEIHRALKFFQG